jgi:AmiR/NasT family two-component response regulator
MERYGLTEEGAVALLGRLARKHHVTVRVIAGAVIAASLRRGD